MRGRLGAALGLAAVTAVAAGCETSEAASQGQGAAAASPAANQPMVPVQNTLTYDPRTVARQMRVLDALIARGETQKKEEFLAVNAADPERPLTKFLNAYAREDRRAAWRDLDGVRKAYPGSALGYLGMLSVYAEWKLTEQAEQTYQKTIGLDAKLAVAHSRLAGMYVLRGNAAKAEEYYQKALGVDPDEADALLGLARMKVAAGDKPGALALYEKAAPLWPENASLARERGALLEEAGRRKDAAQVYLVAASLERRPFDQLMKAAVMLAQEGDRRGAESVYQQALQHNPTDGDLLLTLGQLAAERADVAAQMGYFARAVEQKPDDVELHRALANHFVSRGESAGAERHLQELVRLNPSLQEPHLQMARLSEAQGKQREVLEHYMDAAALGPLPDVDAARKDALERTLNLPPAPPSGPTPQKVFDAALKSIIKAYEARLKEKPELAGGVTAELEVGPDGRVNAVKLKEDSLGDEQLSTMIYFTLKRAVFPEGKKAKFNYPISFAAPKKKGKK
jgi:tetratricopeptide (TPR) repeat protein